MKAFRHYLATSILLLSFLSIYLPVRYHTSYPREIGPQFDNHIRTTYIELLNERQPDLMLIGDSMLEPAVDDQILANRLHKKTLMVGLPGTASTIWYLMIKNNIVLAEHKPKYLLLFFRDSMMTVPGYRVTGRYFEQIDEFASPKDKLLIQRAYINQMSPLDKFMEAYVPLYGLRLRVRQSIDYYIRHSLGRELLHCDATCMDYSMEAVFKANNLDLTFLSDAIAFSDAYIYTRKALDFDNQIDQSFLPEIIRLCKEHGIQLILVRMPILSFARPGTAPAGLSTYIQNLAQYLDKNDVAFLDFDQKELTNREYFVDSIHMNEKGKAAFTPKLVQALLNVIR
jgi:hypothetical protein